MEESTNTFKKEADLSDSWTVVNDDDDLNAENGETSDSESLEVLEVEQEEPEQNSPEDLEKGDDENDDEECTIKDCDNSFLLEDPLIHLAAIQKVRKYVHHPSAYINMWLSVVMMIAIAVTLGLGIGHYLGSKRFAKAKDVIHHLQYENQMLEQELADVIMKNKYCENDLHNKVRQLVMELKWSDLPDHYFRSNHFQENMYTNVIYGHNEDVCYAEENPLFANLFKDSFVNESMLPVVQWFSYVNNGEQNLNFSSKDGLVTNRCYISTKNHDNTSLDVELLPKLEVINNKMYKNKLHFSFPKLNTRLTNLYSLLKKWNEFHEKLKLSASASKTESHQNAQHLSEVAHKVVPLVSGSAYKVPCENVKHMLPNSSNGFCRSKVNQCILHEEKLKNQEGKCKALSNVQLLCSLLQRSKKEQGNAFLLGKQKGLRKKDKKPDVPKFSFEQNRHKRIEKIKNEKKENGKISSKMGSYSKSGSKKMKKKDKVNSSKFVGRKENNYKFKYITRSRNTNKKEKTHFQFRKPTKKQKYNHLQHQRKQQSKPITKVHKQYKKYDSKEIFKNKDERDIIWDKDKIKYSVKFSVRENMNRENAKRFKKCPNYKEHCQFHMNNKKMSGENQYFTHSRFDSSKNAFNHHSEKFSIAENPNGKNAKNLKKRSNGEGLCKFHLKDKKITEDKKCSTFGTSENSYKYKTKNINSKKNGSENASCKYSFIVHHTDKNFQKYWKERSKIYEIHMQEMKILKS